MKLVIMASLPITAFAQSDKPMKVIWERTYGDDRRESNPCVMAISKNSEDVFIAGTTTSLDAEDPVNNCWIWKLDKNGERIKTYKFEWPSKENIIPGYTHTRGMIPLDHDELLMIIEFIPEHPRVVKIGADGRVLFSKDLLDAKRRVAIGKVIESSDGNILLIGQEYSDRGIVIKVSSDGKTLWEKTFADNKPEILSNIISREDGGFTLFAIKSVSPRQSGDPHLLLVACDDKGNTEAKREYPGRFGSVCRLEDRKYFILHDKPNADLLTQSIWASLLDRGFKDLSSHKVDEIQLATGQVQVCSKANDMIISLSKDFKPCFVKIGEDGKTSTMWMDKRSDTIHDNISLVRSGGNVIAMMTVITEDASQKMSIKCLLMCLSVD